jgi:hypothetical protein
MGATTLVLTKIEPSPNAMTQDEGLDGAAGSIELNNLKLIKKIYIR